MDGTCQKFPQLLENLVTEDVFSFDKLSHGTKTIW